jgi:hypothetical protein
MTAAVLQPPILLAAGIDWLEAILPILFVGFWIVSQVFALLRRVGGGPAQPPVVRLPEAPRADDARRMPQPGGDGDPRAELEKQIADFLRQVTGDDAGPRRPPARPQPKPQPAPTTASSKPLSPRPQAAQPPRPKPAAAQAPRQVGTLAAGPSDVARHVQDAFAHELGHLHSGLEKAAEESAKVAAAKPPARGGLSAHDLVAAAHDPATIRQAILLREILERPVDRW